MRNICGVFWASAMKRLYFSKGQVTHQCWYWEPWLVPLLLWSRDWGRGPLSPAVRHHLAGHPQPWLLYAHWYGGCLVALATRCIIGGPRSVLGLVRYLLEPTGYIWHLPVPSSCPRLAQWAACCGVNVLAIIFLLSLCIASFLPLLFKYLDAIPLHHMAIFTKCMCYQPVCASWSFCVARFSNPDKRGPNHVHWFWNCLLFQIFSLVLLLFIEFHPSKRGLCRGLASTGRFLLCGWRQGMCPFSCAWHCNVDGWICFRL